MINLITFLVYRHKYHKQNKEMNEKNTGNLYHKGLTYLRHKRLPVYEKKKINNPINK